LSREQMLELERTKRREKLKELRNEIAQVEMSIQRCGHQLRPEDAAPAVTRLKETKKELEKRLEPLEDGERQALIEFRQAMRDMRRAKIRAEEKVRSIEFRQSRQREDFTSQRERMQRRLQQLEDKTLDLQPADRFRDVERKLDAIRREFGELRRALERQ